MPERRDEWGVLLLAHGAPERLEDIPEFLLRVRGGRPLPPQTVEEIKARYARIGGGSPLRAQTERQAEALAARLGLPVYVGMRNWHPFIASAVEQIVRQGIQRVVALCLAPQNSRTSVGLYRQHLEEATARAGGAFEVSFIESWHDHPLLIRAFAEKLQATLAQARPAAGNQVPVILTAHSVPERTLAEGDPYAEQARETAARVAAEAGCELWTLAYQSQGMTPEPWLGPSVESAIDTYAVANHRHVVVSPIGFVTDNVEILYDIEVVFHEHARTRGVTLWRTESLNETPTFIEALAALALDSIRARAPAPPMAGRASST